jgi:hypothetical protein
MVSNLNAVSITSINITESNLFSSNVVADALSGSNIMEGGSNLIEKYALSNALNNMNSNLFTFTSSNFPSFSNATWCNMTALSNALSNCCSTNTTNFTAFSNWSSCDFEEISNAYSNFTLTTYPTFSNATWCNLTSINNTITGVSNWTDATFRKNANQVPWNDISGKSDFNLSHTSIDFAGVALGAAGLLFGGYAILNNQGQLVGDLANVGSTLKLVADGSTYSKIPNAQFGDYVPDTIDLSEVGSMSAKLAEFLNVKATSLKIGTTSLTLSNNQILFTNGATSNMIIGSNSVTVFNNQPFTFSNANVIATCNVSAPTFTEGGFALNNKYVLSNAQSSFALGSTLATFSNWISPRAATTGNGITIQGNFGQFQSHFINSNLNSNPTMWGWNYVMGSTNAPNTTSSQWYRKVISLGGGFPMRGTNFVSGILIGDCYSTLQSNDSRMSYKNN